MTRYVLDASAVLQLIGDEVAVPRDHELLAPTLLRSQVLSALHEAVHAGRLEPEVGRARLQRFNALKVRFLGDAVLRRRAWEIADRLGWPTTYDAEYVALTQLQADAFITMDVDLAGQVAGIVATATLDMLNLDQG